MATISTNGTTKQKPRLDLNGHSYIKDRGNDTKTYWRCIKYSSHQCRSRLHTCNVTNAVIKSPTKHTCKIDGSALELRKFQEEIVYRARHTQETPDLIVTNAYKSKNI
jgi:hypothetical protein